MDVGYFISELLAQHGDVSVPGLGYFAHTRINGRYNEREGKFYPPTYSVQFDPQGIDDQTLAQYIADKKNISLASSKYFTEKFVNSVKLQAQMGEAPLADLGWFYVQDSQLFFRPNTDISADPDFFGYEPVTLHKLGTAPAESAPADFSTAPAEDHASPVAVPLEEEIPAAGFTYETDEEHAAYLIRESHRRRRNSIITFVILAILFTGLVVYLVDRYNPSIFNLDGLKPAATKKGTVIAAKVVAVEDTVRTALPKDTASSAENTTAKDTLSKVTTAATDSIGFPRWEVMGGTFKTLAEANNAVKNYATLGVQAHIAEGVPGPRFHVSLGTYKTYTEASKQKRELLKTKKVKKDIYPREIKPKL